jgi:outer membrane immunogenic protein
MNLTHQQALFGRSTATRAAARGRPAAAIALFAVLLSSSSYGADYSPPPALPDYSLRGSETEPVGAPTYPRWDGFYFGAQAGQSFGNVDFGNASASQSAYILANSDLQADVSKWATLPQVKANSLSYGGFIGYNIQWGEVITGFELNYNHVTLNAAASDSLGPLRFAMQPQPDKTTIQYAAAVSSSAAVAIHDIMTARARAGWTIDRLLPYGFVGVAVGRADVFRFTDVSVWMATTPAPVDLGGGVFFYPPQGPFNPVFLSRNPQTDSKSQIAYGFTAGLGVEVGVTPNMFLRAEWEFVEFPNVSDFRVQINAVHVGVGLKF